MDDRNMFESLINSDIWTAKVIENENNKFTELLHDPKNEFYLELWESKNESHLGNASKEEKEKLSWQSVIDMGNIDTMEDFILEIDDDRLNCEDQDGNTPLTLVFQKMSTFDVLYFYYNSFFKN